jgi:hypothetical protein
MIIKPKNMDKWTIFTVVGRGNLRKIVDVHIKNKAVNINLVRSIEIYEYKTNLDCIIFYYIEFNFNKDYNVTWKFLSKKERDDAFEHICNLPI